MCGRVRSEPPPAAWCSERAPREPLAAGGGRQSTFRILGRGVLDPGCCTGVLEDGQGMDLPPLRAKTSISSMHLGGSTGRLRAWTTPWAAGACHLLAAHLVLRELKNDFNRALHASTPNTARNVDVHVDAKKQKGSYGTLKVALDSKNLAYSTRRSSYHLQISAILI
eukprot:779586-Prorocentrum_minimum.AAC.1